MVKLRWSREQALLCLFLYPCPTMRNLEVILPPYFSVVSLRHQRAGKCPSAEKSECLCSCAYLERWLKVAGFWNLPLKKRIDFSVPCRYLLSIVSIIPGGIESCHKEE